MRMAWAVLLAALLAIVLAAGAGHRRLAAPQLARADRTRPLRAVAMPPDRLSRRAPSSRAATSRPSRARACRSSGDGGPARSATTPVEPGAVAVDGGGAVYLTDTAGRSIRRIGPTASSDLRGQPRRPLSALSMTDLAFDAAGNLYLVDEDGGRIFASTRPAPLR